MAIVETLKYTVIKNEKQYLKYCDILEKLVFSGEKGKQVQDEIDEFGSKSMTLRPTINARAPRYTPSRTDCVNLRAVAARNTANASRPNSAMKPASPKTPSVIIQWPSVMLESAPFQPA